MIVLDIAAGVLAIAAAAGHAVLGERYTLASVDKADGLKAHDRRLVRALWHLASIVWLVLGLLVLSTAFLAPLERRVTLAIAAILLASGLANFLALRRLHVGGIVLCAAALLLAIGLQNPG